MSGLREFLSQKRRTLAERDAAAQTPGAAATPLRVHVTAEGRSGIRRIRIRDFQVITDSPPSFAGYDLGPSSPELALGALGSCLTHSYLIQAAAANLPLDALEVEVAGRIDPRAGKPGFEDVPVYPHAIEYTVHLKSDASPDRIEAVRLAVERTCPILNLLRHAQTITGHIAPAAPLHRSAATLSLNPEGVP